MPLLQRIFRKKNQELPGSELGRSAVVPEISCTTVSASAGTTVSDVTSPENMAVPSDEAPPPPSAVGSFAAAGVPELEYSSLSMRSSAVGSNRSGASQEQAQHQRSTAFPWIMAPQSQTLAQDDETEVEARRVDAGYTQWLWDEVVGGETRPNWQAVDHWEAVGQLLPGFVDLNGRICQKLCLTEWPLPPAESSALPSKHALARAGLLQSAWKEMAGLNQKMQDIENAIDVLLSRQQAQKGGVPAGAGAGAGEHVQDSDQTLVEALQRLSLGGSEGLPRQVPNLESSSGGNNSNSKASQREAVLQNKIIQDILLDQSGKLSDSAKHHVVQTIVRATAEFSQREVSTKSSEALPPWEREEQCQVSLGRQEMRAPRYVPARRDDSMHDSDDDDDDGAVRSPNPCYHGKRPRPDAFEEMADELEDQTVVPSYYTTVLAGLRDERIEEAKMRDTMVKRICESLRWASAGYDRLCGLYREDVSIAIQVAIESYFPGRPCPFMAIRGVHGQPRCFPPAVREVLRRPEKADTVHLDAHELRIDTKTAKGGSYKKESETRYRIVICNRRLEYQSARGKKVNTVKDGIYREVHKELFDTLGYWIEPNVEMKHESDIQKEIGDKIKRVLRCTNKTERPLEETKQLYLDARMDRLKRLLWLAPPSAISS